VRQLLRPQLFKKSAVRSQAVRETRLSADDQRRARLPTWRFVSTLLDGRSYRLPLWENYRHSGEPKGEIAQAFAQVQRMLNILVRTEYALDLITCVELQLTIVGVHRPANGLIRRGSFKNGLEVLDGFVKPYIDEDLPLSRRKITVYPR